MSNCPAVNLKGLSGNCYSFTVFPKGTPFNDVGAVYAFLRDKGACWMVLYIGQTGGLRQRFSNHHREADFTRHCATHVAVLCVANENDRRGLEQDLVANYEPVLNETSHG